MLCIGDGRKTKTTVSLSQSRDQDSSSARVKRVRNKPFGKAEARVLYAIVPQRDLDKCHRALLTAEDGDPWSEDATLDVSRAISSCFHRFL